MHQQSSSMRLGRDDNGLMRFEYRIEASAIVERRQDAELTLGQIVSFIRASVGARWSPEEVHFEHPRPEAWREHEQALERPSTSPGRRMRCCSSRTCSACRCQHTIPA